MTYILYDEDFEKLKELWELVWLQIDDGLIIDEIDNIINNAYQELDIDD